MTQMRRYLLPVGRKLLRRITGQMSLSQKNTEPRSGPPRFV
jgi:hypothetical protein